MSDSESAVQLGRGRTTRTLLCVLVLFGIETAFAAGLPFLLLDAGVTSAGTTGLLLAASNGAGFVLLPFAVRMIDGPKRAIFMLGNGLLLSGSALLLGLYASALSLTNLALAVLCFGVTRVLVTIGLLTEVAELPGNKTATQGLNGAMQRGGSLLALVGVVVLVAGAAWANVFVAIGFAALAWTLLVALGARRTTTRLDVQGRLIDSMSACFAQLRHPAVLAATSLNIILLISLLMSNSFIAVVLESEAVPAVGDDTASLVFTIIIVRDAVSVLSGVLFSLLARRMRQSSILYIVLVAAALPIVLLLFGDASRVGLAVAVLHGVTVGGGIAVVNLMAALAGSADQIGTRLIASQVPAGIVLLIAPIVFGYVLEGYGAIASYGVLLVIVMLCALAVLRSQAHIRLVS